MTNSSHIEDLADALYDYQVRSSSRPEAQVATTPFAYATWLGPEGADENLSRIKLANGTVIRGVPKFRGASGLVYGATIICINPGPSMVLTIMDSIVGNITAYQAET